VKIRAFDSWAILEWMRGAQPAYHAVSTLLTQAESDLAKLFMSAINVGEVCYFLLKNHSAF